MPHSASSMELRRSMGRDQTADHVHRQSWLGAVFAQVYQVARTGALEHDVHADSLSCELIPGWLILRMHHENTLCCVVQE